MNFTLAQRSCRIHAASTHWHARVCVTCLTPLVDGICAATPWHGHGGSNQTLGTWGQADNWKCIEELA